MQTRERVFSDRTRNLHGESAAAGSRTALVTPAVTPVDTAAPLAERGGGGVVHPTPHPAGLTDSPGTMGRVGRWGGWTGRTCPTVIRTGRGDIRIIVLPRLERARPV